MLLLSTNFIRNGRSIFIMVVLFAISTEKE